MWHLELTRQKSTWPVLIKTLNIFLDFSPPRNVIINLVSLSELALVANKIFEYPFFAELIIISKLTVNSCSSGNSSNSATIWPRFGLVNSSVSVKHFPLYTDMKIGYGIFQVEQLYFLTLHIPPESEDVPASYS